jgi:hypothetical protein
MTIIAALSESPERPVDHKPRGKPDEAASENRKQGISAKEAERCIPRACKLLILCSFVCSSISGAR